MAGLVRWLRTEASYGECEILIHLCLLFFVSSHSFSLSSGGGKGNGFEIKRESGMDI